MESLSGVWNGDVDLGDGKLEELRREYDQRVALLSNIARIDNRDGLQLEGKSVLTVWRMTFHFLLMVFT